MYGSGNNSFMFTEDKIRRINKDTNELVSELKRPGSIESTINKTLNEKLEKGETLVFGDKKGIYHLKKVDGIVQKTYVEYYK